MSMMVAEVETVGGVQVGTAERLFELAPEYLRSGVADAYDVAPDDERFLMGRIYQGNEESGASSLIMVQNFFEELKRLVPN